MTERSSTDPSRRGDTLVIGAGSGIAQAVIEAQLARTQGDLIAVSRHPPTDSTRDRVHFLQCDYSGPDITRVINRLKAENRVPDKIVICNGLLHNDRVFPEKQLQAFSAAQWQEVMQASTLTPMLWLQNLVTLLPAKHPATVAILSARVGSITDNRSGGWYSYRAAKAALNMLVKTAAVELRRTHPHLGLLLFHPGTTDTPLSLPFQQRVPEGRLFTPGFVAERLLTLMQEQAAGQLRFIDWAGKTIDW